MATTHDVSVEAPSRVRWLIFCLACGTSWFLYLHRYAWNIILPEFQKAHGLNNTEGGFFTSLFYWTYAGGQIPSGVVIDLFGPHLFLGTSIVLWSFALIGFGLLTSLYGVGAMRLVFGVAQAGCYPGLTKVTRAWFPLRTRTTVQGWVATTFGRAGGAMSPIILGTILMGRCGLHWQSALFVMGGVGILFGVAFLLLYRNSPAEHPAVNQAERELIADGNVVQTMKGTLPWANAVRSRSLLCFMVQQFLDAGSDLVFATLIGSYFLYRHHMNIKDVGWLSSLPLWGGALGGIVGGWLNDRLIRTTGNRRWTRSGVGFVGKVIGCVMLFMASSQDSVLIAGIALMLGKFFSDWSQPTTWGTCTDLGGRCSATVFSIINTAGTVGGVVMPLVFGWVLDLNTKTTLVGDKVVSSTDWGPLFLVVAAMYLASGIFWLLIDCSKPLDTPD